MVISLLALKEYGDSILLKASGFGVTNVSSDGRRSPSLATLFISASLCAFTTACPLREGECDGQYSPFARGQYVGFGGAYGNEMFPGALSIFIDFTTFASYECDPIAIGSRPDLSCVDVPGGEFCQRLIKGDLCYGAAEFTASDVALLEECMTVWGEKTGFDFQACTFQGAPIEEGACDEFFMAFDRIRGCLERRGSGAMWENPCIILNMSLNRPLNPDCPWWESDECFEMYLSPP